MSDMDSLREELIDAAIAHVPFDGWGDKALLTAAKNQGIEPVVARNAFPGGAIEMIEFHSLLADRRMVAEFEAADISGLKLREKVALAVRLRLQANMPHREAIRRAVATLALPIHAALAARLLYRTVDAVWHAVGDRSTDYNFYTKRMLLAGVYSSTVLFWINDKSADCAETWAFLDRRIADVMQIPKAMARLNKIKDRLPDPMRILRRRAAR
ncbi:MAG TPA: COQ9 family protein [Candidatus Polarisedimenticolia bacterium]|nr:COQ9 family protein [Candidatus Polarisedimenticolia bacterium]